MYVTLARTPREQRSTNAQALAFATSPLDSIDFLTSRTVFS